MPLTEAQKAYQRDYYQKNKEKILAYHHEYHQKNKGQIHAKKRAYYVKNREAIIAKAKECIERPGIRDKRVRRMAKKHVERQLILWEIKRDSGCVRCGERATVVLDFHHRDPKDKVAKLPTMTSRAWSEVEKELEKCTVLCANCHAREHRRDWGALFESKEL